MSTPSKLKNTKVSEKSAKQYQLRSKGKKGDIGQKPARKMATSSPQTHNPTLAATYAEATPSSKTNHVVGQKPASGSATPILPTAQPDIPVQAARPRTGSRQSQHEETGTPTMLSAISEAVKTAVTESNAEINLKLDKALNDIASFKTDLDATNRAVAELQISVSDTSERVSIVERATIPNVIEETRKLVANLEENLLQQEIHMRKLNLLLYGIDQKKDENILTETTKAIAELLNIPYEEADKIPIANAHRLPSARNFTKPNTPNPPNPIIVRFARMKDRDDVLKAFEHPGYARRRQSTSHNEAAIEVRPAITVRADLPPSMKRERGRLSSIAYKLRQEKKLMTRIKVFNTKVILQTKRNREDTWATWREWLILVNIIQIRYLQYLQKC